MIHSDKVFIGFIILFTLAFKALDLNVWKYDMLRVTHSKNYIRNNYTGAGEWILFSKSIREIGIVLPVINFLILMLFIAEAGVLYLVMNHQEVRFHLAVITAAFAVCSIITTLMTIHNYDALGISVKGNKVNYGERIITAVSFTAIICFLAFVKSRGVFF